MSMVGRMFVLNQSGNTSLTLWMDEVANTGLWYLVMPFLMCSSSGQTGVSYSISIIYDSLSWRLVLDHC
jgi:hypothetical protein